MKLTKNIFTNFLLLFFASFIAAHVLFSYAESKFTTYFYGQALLNVRKLKFPLYKEILYSFLENGIRHSKKPVLLVVGTSFSYGDFLKIKSIYSTALQKKFPNYHVLNASVIGDVGLDVARTLAMLYQQKLHVNTLIIELNLGNLVEVTRKPDISYGMSRGAYLNLELAKYLDRHINSYFGFYMTHLFGLAFPKIMDLNRLFSIRQHILHRFANLNYPRSYFDSAMKFNQDFRFKQQLIDMILSQATKVADHVYFFIAPIAKQAVISAKFDPTIIAEQVDRLNRLCERFSPKIDCLNPGYQFSQNNFMDITHLNENGQQVFASWLVKQTLHHGLSISTSS